MKRPIVWIAVGYISTIAVVSFVLSQLGLCYLAILVLGVGALLDRKTMPFLLAGMLMGGLVMLPSLKQQDVLKEAFGEAGVVTGTITAVSPISDRFGYFEVEGSLLLEGRSPQMGSFQLSSNSITEVEVGSAITVTGTVGAIEQGITWGYAMLIPITPTAEPCISAASSIRGKLLAFGATLQNKINETLSGDTAALVNAIALGNKEGISPELQQDLRRASLSHIVVVSGQHLMIVATLLGYVKGKKGRLYSIFMLCGVWAFALLTGLSPSVLRSGLMVTIVLVLSLAGITADTFESLSIAVILIGAYRPELLFSYSLMISMAAVLGIALLGRRLAGELCGLLRRIGMKAGFCTIVADGIGVIIGAQLGALPIIAVLSGTLSLWGVVTNLLVMPLIPFVIVLGLFTAIAGVAFPTLGAILAVPLGLFVVVVERVATYFGNLPFGVWNIRERWMLILLFGAVFAVVAGELYSFSRSLHRTAWATALSVILLVTGAYSLTSKGMEFLIIGDGASCIYLYEGDAVVAGIPTRSEDFYALKKGLSYLNPDKITLVELGEDSGKRSMELILDYPVTAVRYEESMSLDPLVERNMVTRLESDGVISLGDTRLSLSASVDLTLLQNTQSITPLYFPVTGVRRYRFINHR